MAVGDGITWDETTPTNATNATEIDDYNRDVRLGIRGRMAHEHEWPAVQSLTSEAGKHKYVTLQTQGTKPTLAGTQTAAVYCKSTGTGVEAYVEDSAGNEVQITNTGGIRKYTGDVVQYVYSIFGTANSGTTAIPSDDTIPQIAEGTEFMTRTITPKSATNVLEIDCMFYGDHAGAAILAGAIFQDTTAGAIAVGADFRSIANETLPLAVGHSQVAGTTGERTYSFRAGGNGGAKVVFNGNSSTDVRRYGGVYGSYMRIKEIQA